ncbi:hypothetical protein A0H81_01151 [Grifola frondosa]|uniref:N-terminal Ras-GEF domain-containing protein n=1 Tax=Grifola frondosa TaxID=5627 RepID=A0A1C7MRX7_GRIFR|nr:hypothetical protein A0H81_01151 [Grifola frondosa]
MPSRPVPPGPAATDVHPSQDASPFSSNTVRQHDATGLSHASSTGHDKRTLHNSVPARSRGISVSTVDDRDGPPYDESDMERSEDVIRRARKGKGTSRQFVSPGELPLPSRLQSKGSSPTMSKSSAAIVPARSSSLNHRLAKQKSLMSVNTHIPMPHQLPEICLVVVGAAGCGKSTFIRKGLKAYGLSESESISIHPSPTGPEDEIFTYTLRTGKIPASQDTPERLLRVLEVDVSALDIQGPHKIWPGLTPSWDAALICYDASNEESFIHVEDIMGAFGDLKLPTVVLACKSELERRVDPSRASVVLRPYDVGLVEISVATSQGKEKMRDTFDWLFRAIIENQSFGLRNGLRNPASPAVLTSPPPWEVARASSATPTASSNIPRTPSTPTSPTRARSTSDLLSEHEKSKREEREQHVGKLGMAGMRSRGSLHTHPGAAGSTDGLIHMDEAHDGTREISMKGSRAPPWMSLEDLLNKLLFMAVSDDDPVFVSHFLLTYRRFASPRAVLLAMQKRMRSLDQPTGDPMFACYAQMRICHLLDTWITLYPNDFAVHGAASALGALIKSILSKTYLLHYGSDFLPFLELVPSLKDEDAGWALKVEDEGDDSSILDDEERSLMLDSESPVSTSPAQTFVDADAAHTPTTGFTQPSFTRERKASLPLTAKALVALNPATSPTNSMHESFLEHSPKQILRRLLAISQELQPLDPQVIAEEITRFEAAYFAKIEVRVVFGESILTVLTWSTAAALVAAGTRAGQEGRGIRLNSDV